MFVPTLRSRVLLPVLSVTLVLLSACASGSSGGSASSTSRATGGTTVTVDVHIANGKITPVPGAVEAKKGDHIDLKVTSDKADEVHVHGYDIEKPLVPGQTTEIRFDATQQGRFEVETHESGKTLLQLLVR
jgi:Cupredoxin-like domain